MFLRRSEVMKQKFNTGRVGSIEALVSSSHNLSLRKQILQTFYDSPESGHLGFRKTFQRLL